jgi:hypothetical protein
MLRFRLTILLLPLLITTLQLSCSHKTVSIETDVPSEVTLVDFGAMTSKGTELGATPVTFDVEKMENKAVRVVSTGKTPYYWIYADVSGESITAKFKMVDLPQAEQIVVKESVEANKVQRSLFKAYKLLSRRKFDLAEKISAQVIEMNKFIAMPHIIRGLALLNMGKKAEAQSEFVLAKNLDPADPQIDKLIRKSKN